MAIEDDRRRQQQARAQLNTGTPAAPAAPKPPALARLGATIGASAREREINHNRPFQEKNPILTRVGKDIAAGTRQLVGGFRAGRSGEELTPERLNAPVFQNNPAPAEEPIPSSLSQVAPTNTPNVVQRTNQQTGDRFNEITGPVRPDGTRRQQLILSENAKSPDLAQGTRPTKDGDVPVATATRPDSETVEILRGTQATQQLSTGVETPTSIPRPGQSVDDTFFNTGVEIPSSFNFDAEGLRAAQLNQLGPERFRELTERQIAGSRQTTADAALINARNNVRATTLADERAFALQQPEVTLGPNGEALLTTRDRNGEFKQTDLEAFRRGDTAAPKGYKLEKGEDGLGILVNQDDGSIIPVEQQLLQQDRQTIAAASEQGEGAFRRALDITFQAFDKRQEQAGFDDDYLDADEEERFLLFQRQLGITQ